MTENQRNLILRLRKDGEGYKTIANTVGLSRDRVRSFCKSKNIAGFGAAATLNIEEQATDGSICPNCYAPIVQSTKGRRKKFCSEKCRREW